MLPDLSVYQIKPYFQKLLIPLLNYLYKKKISPNQITLFACASSIIYGICLILFSLSKPLLFIFPLVSFIRMALNALDGMMAKTYNQQTESGAFLNEICDIASDISLIVPFCFYPNIPLIEIICLVIIALISEFVGLAVFITKGVRSFLGPFGKSDRAVFSSILAIQLGINASIAWRTGLIYCAIVLGVLTIFNRTKHGLGDKST